MIVDLFTFLIFLFKCSIASLSKEAIMAKTLPYEFHVTVDAINTNTEKFTKVCCDIGTKAIVLDLGINNGSALSDYMTSSKRQYETDDEAFAELYRLADGLAGAGFVVIRRKIETAPWHSAAPQVDGDTMPDGSYFESHLAIGIAPNQIEQLRNGIVDTTDRLPLHLSRNVFKKINDGKVVIMSTLRDYDVHRNAFETKVADSQERIRELGFSLIKPPIIEFALYDSNTHQDDKWMQR